MRFNEIWVWNAANMWFVSPFVATSKQEFRLILPFQGLYFIGSLKDSQYLIRRLPMSRIHISQNYRDTYEDTEHGSLPFETSKMWVPSKALKNNFIGINMVRGRVHTIPSCAPRLIFSSEGMVLQSLRWHLHPRYLISFLFHSKVK